MNAIDPSAVDPVEFAANVARASDEELARGMSGELRGLILDEIFARMQRHLREDRARPRSGDPLADYRAP